MRAYGNQGPRTSPILIAIVIFVVLLVIMRVMGGQQADVLRQTFAAAPPAANAGEITLPPVPTGIANLARTATARILGGQATAPLSQRGENGALRVAIETIQPEANELRVLGSVTNISSAPVDVSLDAFKFIDETSTVYAITGSPAATIQPGQTAPLDIKLPINNPRQLKLSVEQPGQPPIEIVLLNAAPSTP